MEHGIDVSVGIEKTPFSLTAIDMNYSYDEGQGIEAERTNPQKNLTIFGKTIIAKKNDSTLDEYIIEAGILSLSAFRKMDSVVRRPNK
jgi:hypothetical protein